MPNIVCASFIIMLCIRFLRKQLAGALYSKKRKIYSNNTTIWMTVLLDYNNTRSHVSRRNLFDYTAILPNMLAQCSMLLGTHYA